MKVINLDKTPNILSVCFAVLVLIFIGYSIWFRYQKTLIESCVYYVGVDIVEYSKLDDFLTNTQGWYVLSEDEVRNVLSNKNITFSNCSGILFKPQDIIEKNLKIAISKNVEVTMYSVIVWSRGFDNISGTYDDIVFPYNEKTPN